MIFFFILSSMGFAGDSWKLQNSALTYEVKHLLKTVHGTSKAAKGLVRCEKSSCDFLVATPIASFDSENSSRDTHMQQTMKAGSFPMVETNGKFPAVKDGKTTINVEVKLAGKTHTYPVDMEIKTAKNSFTADGTLPLVLTQFDIERPSLLMSSIDDDAPVKIHLEFAK